MYVHKKDIKIQKLIGENIIKKKMMMMKKKKKK